MLRHSPTFFANSLGHSPPFLLLLLPSDRNGDKDMLMGACIAFLQSYNNLQAMAAALTWWVALAALATRHCLPGLSSCLSASGWHASLCLSSYAKADPQSPWHLPVHLNYKEGISTCTEHLA